MTNELYKIIARILAARIKPLMRKLINHSQSTFIPGCHITDNILLSCGLLRSFLLERGEARMVVKIDLSKAIDNVKWDFLLATLQALISLLGSFIGSWNALNDLLSPS